MAEYIESNAGKFRANPNASDYNNLRLVSETPGTIQQDNGTVNTTSGIHFEGVEYTGKDGVAIYIQFSDQDIPQGTQKTKFVAVDAGRDALKKALQTILERHEVDPIITVTGTGASFIVRHVGAGTLSGIYMDGAKTSLTRTALS